ncbi:MAG: hypothetical protein M0036_19190 [Desulfobacteraceae bacterium]|nr:hypothetical protein [Desulfobacteraceae bacterium]
MLNRLQAKKNPLLVIETDPDILDLLAPYDEERECNPDMFDEWVENFNARHETQHTAAQLPAELQENCLRELYGDDYDRYQWHWSDIKECLQQMLDENGYERGDLFVVEASPCGWHGRSGERTFKYDGSSEQFIRESFASLDSRTFHARLWNIDRKEIKATVSCHDIPTGAAMEVIKVNRCETCDEVFVPKHKHHRFCTSRCRRQNARL